MSSPLFNGPEFTQRFAEVLNLADHNVKSITLRTNQTEPPEVVIVKSITKDEESRLFALLSCYNLVERSTNVV